MLETWIGLVGGILIGATGAGVGSLVTPLLILAGHRPAVAVGTGLGVLVASKFTGAVVHQRLGHWPGRAAWILVAGGVLGVPLAWGIASTCLPLGTPHSDLWLRRVLAASLLATALSLRFCETQDPRLRPWNADKSPVLLFLAGLVVGALMTLTSAGSGSLLVPLLLLTTAWGVPQLAAMSNLFGWIVGILSVALHVRLGHLEAPLFAAVMLGLLPGVVAGALLSRCIARRWFVLGMDLVAVYLGMRLLHA